MAVISGHFVNQKFKVISRLSVCDNADKGRECTNEDITGLTGF